MQQADDRDDFVCAFSSLPPLSLACFLSLSLPKPFVGQQKPLTKFCIVAVACRVFLAAVAAKSFGLANFAQTAKQVGAGW